MIRKNLSDILRVDEEESFKQVWGATKAATEFAPLPAGDYVTHVVSGELFLSKANTPGVKICFKVIEGDYARKHIWLNLWFSPAALPMTKRDLAKLGVTDPEQLEKPIPQGIRCRVKVAVRKEENGDEFNRVKSFEVLGIDTPEVDPFAPANEKKGGSTL